MVLTNFAFRTGFLENPLYIGLIKSFPGVLLLDPLFSLTNGFYPQDALAKIDFKRLLLEITLFWLLVLIRTPLDLPSPELTE